MEVRMNRKAFLVGDTAPGDSLVFHYSGHGSQVPKGTLFAVILDCCHSGTGLREFLRPDLPIRYKFLPTPVEVRHRSEPRIENRGIDRSVTLAGPDKALPVRRFGISLSKTNAVLIAETGGALADHNFDQVPQLEGPARLISSEVFGRAG
jgi:hypothetical protein